MLRKLFLALPLCLTGGAAFGDADVSADTLNWDEATWSCPSSIEVNDKSYPLRRSTVYDGPPENMAALVPEERKDLAIWSDSGRNYYLDCEYSETAKFGDPKKNIIIHTLGASFSGKPLCAATDKPVRVACWRNAPQ